MTPSQPVTIVTDSAAGIPPAMVHQYRIGVVPYELLWDGVTYRDGIDITPQVFYERFTSSPTYPTTAQPTPAAFQEAYRAALREAEEVVSLHVSERLTTAIRVARLAAQETAPGRIRVVDTHTAAAAEGFVVLAAARAAAEGRSAQEVIAAAEACIPRVGLLCALETLEHLRRGGRIGQAALLLGARLNVQPVIAVVDGQLRPIGVTRSRQQAKERVLTELERRCRGGAVRVSVFHANVPDEAEEMAQQVRERFDCIELLMSEFTPVMGAHTGPGIIGLGYCLENAS